MVALAARRTLRDRGAVDYKVDLYIRPGKQIAVSSKASGLPAAGPGSSRSDTKPNGFGRRSPPGDGVAKTTHLRRRVTTSPKRLPLAARQQRGQSASAAGTRAQANTEPARTPPARRPLTRPKGNGESQSRPGNAVADDYDDLSSEDDQAPLPVRNPALGKESPLTTKRARNGQASGSQKQSSQSGPSRPGWAAGRAGTRPSPVKGHSIASHSESPSKKRHAPNVVKTSKKDISNRVSEHVDEPQGADKELLSALEDDCDVDVARIFNDTIASVQQVAVASKQTARSYEEEAADFASLFNEEYLRQLQGANERISELKNLVQALENEKLAMLDEMDRQERKAEQTMSERAEKDAAMVARVNSNYKLLFERYQQHKADKHADIDMLLNNMMAAVKAYKEDADKQVDLWRREAEKQRQINQEAAATDTVNRAEAIIEDFALSKQALLKADGVLAVQQQEIEELRRIVSHLSRDRPTVADGCTQADPAISSVGVQVEPDTHDAAAGRAGCWRSPATRRHARCRAEDIGVTGIACAMVPEGIDASSLDTYDLRLGLLQPSVPSAALLQAQEPDCMETGDSGGVPDNAPAPAEAAPAPATAPVHTSWASAALPPAGAAGGLDGEVERLMVAAASTHLRVERNSANASAVGSNVLENEVPHTPLRELALPLDIQDGRTSRVAWSAPAGTRAQRATATFERYQPAHPPARPSAALGTVQEEALPRRTASASPTPSTDTMDSEAQTEALQQSAAALAAREGMRASAALPLPAARPDSGSPLLDHQGEGEENVSPCAPALGCAGTLTAPPGSPARAEAGEATVAPLHDANGLAGLSNASHADAAAGAQRSEHGQVCDPAACAPGDDGGAMHTSESNPTYEEQNPQQQQEGGDGVRAAPADAAPQASPRPVLASQSATGRTPSRQTQASMTPQRQLRDRLLGWDLRLAPGGGSLCRDRHTGFTFTLRASSPDGSPLRLHDQSASQSGDPEEIMYSPQMGACPTLVRDTMLDVFKEPFVFQARHLNDFHVRLSRQLSFVHQKQRGARGKRADADLEKDAV